MLTTEKIKGNTFEPVFRRKRGYQFWVCYVFDDVHVVHLRKYGLGFKGVHINGQTHESAWFYDFAAPDPDTAVRSIITKLYE